MDPATVVGELHRYDLPAPRLPSVGDVDSSSRVKRYTDFKEHIEDVLRSWKFPASYNPVEPDQRTQEFLDSLGISGLWQRDPFAEKAMHMLDEPHVRRALQVFLLGPLNYESIARRLRDRFGLSEIDMNPRVVSSFGFYFWDYASLDIEEWRTFLYSYAGPSEDMQTALMAPRNTAGAALTLWVADRSSTEGIHELELFKFSRDLCYIDLLKAHMSLKPGLNKSTAMHQLLNAVVTSQEQIDLRRGGSAELMEELKRFEPIHDNKKLTTIRDLRDSDTIDAEYEEVDNEG